MWSSLSSSSSSLLFCVCVRVGVRPDGHGTIAACECSSWGMRLRYEGLQEPLHHSWVNRKQQLCTYEFIAYASVNLRVLSWYHVLRCLSKITWKKITEKKRQCGWIQVHCNTCSLHPQSFTILWQVWKICKGNKLAFQEILFALNGLIKLLPNVLNVIVNGAFSNITSSADLLMEFSKLILGIYLISHFKLKTARILKSFQ